MSRDNVQHFNYLDWNRQALACPIFTSHNQEQIQGDSSNYIFPVHPHECRVVFNLCLGPLDFGDLFMVQILSSSVVAFCQFQVPDRPRPRPQSSTKALYAD